MTRDTAREQMERLRGGSLDPDGELVERIRRGSGAHFSEFYERYFHRLYHFAYQRLGNQADAEEVVQETFTAVFRCIDTFRGQSMFSFWVYGIAKNTLNIWLRHVEPLPVQEIAVRTQCSNDAVHSSLYRTKRLFFGAAGSETESSHA